MTDSYDIARETVFEAMWENPEFMSQMCDMAEGMNILPGELVQDLLFFSITATLSEYADDGATPGVIKMVASKLALDFAELLATAVLLIDPSIDGIADPKTQIN